MSQDGIEPAYPELFFIGIGRAAWLGARAAGRGIAELGEKIKQRLAQYQTESLFRRPNGVPKDWVKSSTKSKNGVLYTKPNSKGTTYIKIERGKPNSSNIGQRYDNVRWMRNGESLDVNGNVVPKKSLESHIPFKEFKFRMEIFK